MKKLYIKYLIEKRIKYWETKLENLYPYGYNDGQSMYRLISILEIKLKNV